MITTTEIIYKVTMQQPDGQLFKFTLRESVEMDDDPRQIKAVDGDALGFVHVADVIQSVWDGDMRVSKPPQLEALSLAQIISRAQATHPRCNVVGVEYLRGSAL